MIASTFEAMEIVFNFQNIQYIVHDKNIEKVD